MRASWWVFAAVLLHSGQAVAQQSGHSTSTPMSNARPMRELRAFGTCVAQTRRPAALALIATVPGSAEEGKTFRQMMSGEQFTCLPGGTRMVIPVVFARGAVAEGLLRFEGVPDTYRLAAPAPAEVRDLHGAARCYTANHRTEVAALLKTDPGSRDETAAVSALWNDFRTCMPDFNVRLNAPWIRFLMAEALLRLEPNTTTSGR